MKRKYLFIALAVNVVFGCVLFWQQTKIHAQVTVQPMQLFGCSYTSRELSVKEGGDENIKKGIWKEKDRETLDNIVTDWATGLHACIAADPNTNRRYIVVFYHDFEKGAAVAIAEQK